jgi:outer membrane protein assembly factor BamB
VTRSGHRVRGRRAALLLAGALLAIAALAGCTQSRSAASQSWSGIVVDGVNVYVGTREGRVIQLNAATGAPGVAPYEAPAASRNEASPAFYGTPTVSGGRVLVGGYQGIVYSLDAATLSGALTYEIPSSGLTKGIAGSIVPAGDALVVAATEDANQGRLYVLEAASLTERCRYPAAGAEPTGQLWTTPVVVDGVAYFGGLGHKLHAVDLADCSLAWAQPTQLDGAIVAPPLAVDGMLYLGAFDRTFYAVDMATGAAQALFEGEGWFWAQAATDGTRVYAANLDGHLHAYDLTSGAIAWTYPAKGKGDPIVSAPVVVDGQVVFASDSEVLTVLDGATGALQWDRKLTAKVRAPLTAAGSVVYIHALDETVSAVDLATKRLVWDRNLDDVK